ncbi:MAG: pilin [Patescibacteria group bacterium]|nr:pilin [Patescibacteria group bacterium]
MVKGKKLIFVFVFLVCFFAVTFTYGIEVDYPDIAGSTIEDSSSVGGFVQYFFKLTILLSVVAVAGLILYTGFVYLTSPANPEKRKGAQKRAYNGFVGLFIILSFVVVVNAINPDLLEINLSSLIEIEEGDDPEEIYFGKELSGDLIMEEIPIGTYMEEELSPIQTRINTIEKMEELKEMIKKERICDDGSCNDASDDDDDDDSGVTVRGISGLNHYLLSISDKCACDNATCHCAPACPTGMPALGCLSLFCEGDVCDNKDEEPRETMEAIEEINKEITEDLQDIKNDIVLYRDDFKKRLNIFQELEKRKNDCAVQGPITENEKNKIERFFEKEEMDIVIKTHKEMGITGSVTNPLNAHCVVGGRLVDSGDFPRNNPVFFDKLWELDYIERIVCPHEYKIGEIFDKTRELAIIIVVKLEILIEKVKEMEVEIQKVSEYVSDIGVHNCEPKCSCIYNPCYELCEIPYCAAYCYCKCLDCVGGCIDEASPYGGLIDDGDRGKIFESVTKMEELEKEILSLKKDINSAIIEIALPINQRVIITNNVDIQGSEDSAKEGENYLITDIDTTNNLLEIYDDIGQKEKGERKEAGWISYGSFEFENDEIERIKQKVSDCYTPVELSSSGEENWITLNREKAVGNYGPLDYRIITNPHPRNLFCCSYSENTKEQYGVPDRHSLDYNIIPAESFDSLLEWSDDDNCIEGYDCALEISLPDELDYTQYDDASFRLKQQISCMRSELDTIQMKEEIGLDDDGNITNPIGDISYITDYCLYEPYNSCSFIFGGDCSFDHNTVYGQKRISSHYGGNKCYETKRSYAVSFSDVENTEYIIKAAKACNASSYVTYIPVSAEGEVSSNHIQVSIAGAYGCGTD